MSFMSFPFLFSTLLSLWSDFSFVDTLKSSIVASGNLSYLALVEPSEDGLQVPGQKDAQGFTMFCIQLEKSCP